MEPTTKDYYGWLSDHLKAMGPLYANQVHQWAKEQGIPRETVVRFLNDPSMCHQCPDFPATPGVFQPGSHQVYCRY